MQYSIYCILQTRIAGDPQHQNNPLVASFDVPVIIGGAIVKFAEIIIIVAFMALPVGMVILILDFNKRMKRGRTSKWEIVAAGNNALRYISCAGESTYDL